MDSIPYSFCYEVLSHLFIHEVDYVASHADRIWQAAANKLPRATIKLYFLTTESSLQYFFTKAWDCPEIVNNEANYSVEALLALGVTSIRIAEVDIGDSEATRSFAKDGAWKADFSRHSPLVKYILKNLQRKNTWLGLSYSGEANEFRGPLLDFFSRIFFDRIQISYNGAATEHFLRAQLKNNRIRNLALLGSWRETVKQDVEDYIRAHDLQSFNLARTARFALDFSVFRRFANGQKYVVFDIGAPFKVSEDEIDKSEFQSLTHMDFVALGEGVFSISACFDRIVSEEPSKSMLDVEDHEIDLMKYLE